MIRLNNDYNEGAIPQILSAMQKMNFEQYSGYGTDEHCEKAKGYIKQFFACPSADVHFLVGGTQTNLTVISSVLKSYQGVVGATSAHVNVHETGAIEATGHKVLTLPSSDGKITAEQVRSLYLAHVTDESFEHGVQPKMVYISFPTELGTTYSLTELKQLYNVCKENGLYLFIDGARLGYGLAESGATVKAEDLAKVCDVFYIGGTKVGALFGEAVVIVNDELKKDFRYHIKQKGAMLAKGWLLGVQFEELFKDGEYMKISRHAIALADKLRTAFQRANIPFLVENATNQLFPILSDESLKVLAKKYTYSYQQRMDETHSAVRFCTSWATKEEDIDSLIEDIEKI